MKRGVSSREVRLYCDSLDFRLSLSYPVNYNTLKIKLSKSTGYLTVSCQRQLYNLEEERPCFTLNPDHHLSLVPTTFNMQMILSQSLMQMTKEESHLVTTLNDIQLYKQSSTHLKVKLFFQTFFESALNYSFFSISFSKNFHCFIVINEMLIDYQHKTPANDLYSLLFC